MKYALFTGLIGNFERDFGDGNVIKLEIGIARQISDEVADILSHHHSIKIFDSFDDRIIEFVKPKIVKTYKTIVKEVGIKKASDIYKSQEEAK